MIKPTLAFAAFLIASPALADDWATEQRLQRLEEYQQQQEYDRASEWNNFRFPQPDTSVQDQIWLENYRSSQRLLDEPIPGPEEWLRSRRD